jgi:hypothetical protein
MLYILGDHCDTHVCEHRGIAGVTDMWSPSASWTTCPAGFYHSVKGALEYEGSTRPARLRLDFSFLFRFSSSIGCNRCSGGEYEYSGSCQPWYNIFDTQ